MKTPTLIISLIVSTLATATHAQSGCTDPLANNYNAAATINDGSCHYNSVSISPSTTFTLPPQLSETSGLLWWNNELWTNNDDTDTHLHAIDTSNGSLLQDYDVKWAVNNDWEDLDADTAYLYIGDFGNNVAGNRTNLKIIRVEKASLIAGNPIIDSIMFSYPDQTNFSSAGANNTNFDCEAMVLTTDSIYLFTKQWVSQKTTLYALSKTPGTYVADSITTYNVQGLITGAVTLQQKQLTVLCGYTNLVQPFLYLLYDYQDNNFFNGNKRKINISLPFHQIEGIASENGLDYFLTNESLVQGPISIAPKLNKFSLYSYLGNYLNSTTGIQQQKPSQFNVYPNPFTDVLHIQSANTSIKYFIADVAGRIVSKGSFSSISGSLSTSDLSKGVYFLTTSDPNIQPVKLIKE